MSSAERHTDTQNIPLLDKPQMVNQSDKKEEIKEDKKTQQHKILEQKSIVSKFIVNVGANTKTQHTENQIVIEIKYCTRAKFNRNTASQDYSLLLYCTLVPRRVSVHCARYRRSRGYRCTNQQPLSS